jgi:hypothetical protein
LSCRSARLPPRRTYPATTDDGETLDPCHRV